MRKGLRALPAVAVVALALALAAVLPASARARIPELLGRVLGEGTWTEALLAPGAVHGQHRDVACLACHEPFRGVGDGATCLSSDCHPAERLSGGPEPRVAALHRQVSGRPCTACHPEHLGRQAAITVAFHATARRGEQEDCAACHDAQAREAHPAIADRRCTACHTSTEDWTRVDFRHERVAGQSCADCHRDAVPGDTLHAAVAGADCAACHTSTASWEQARFDHARVGATACAACHRGAAPRDVLHSAVAGADCAACHTSTASWERVRFDHARVGATACATCHRPPPGGIHAQAQGVSCATCHGTRAWEPASFRHPRLPEMREHMALGCRACHPATLSRAVPCTQCHGRGGFDDD